MQVRVAGPSMSYPLIVAVDVRCVGVAVGVAKIVTLLCAATAVFRGAMLHRFLATARHRLLAAVRHRLRAVRRNMAAAYIAVGRATVLFAALSGLQKHGNRQHQ